MTYGERVNPRRLAPRPSRLVRIASIVACATLAVGTVAPLTSSSAAAGGPPLTEVRADDFPADLSAFYTQQLDWEPCKDGMTCAWMNVPLDYADPSGATIRLRVARVKATGDPAARQGSLVINPGGPGGSAVDFTSYVAQSITPKVNEQFDIVGFDPRGVDHSTPIVCLTGRQTTALIRQDGTPDTAAEQRQLMAIASMIPRGCLTKSPTLARHVGTENTVKDMDVLRAVLGDPKLNWLGFSYGTYMGTLYAEEFPDRVGRFVLDGPVNPANGPVAMSLGQSRAFQVAVSRFAADCAKRSSCAYKGGTKSVLAGINRLLARLDLQEMPAKKGRTLTQSEALTAVFTSMYTTQLWPWLRSGLKQATKNDGSQLLALADYANERTGPDTYANNMASAFYAIGCWDAPAPPGAPGLRTLAARWSAHAPVPEMAQSMAWGMAPCAQWFGHTSRVPAPAASTTTAPILVVGTIYDPATPYPWAIALSNQLPTSTLLTYRGDGHTAFGSGSACIDKTIDTYILTGQLPAKGTVCT